MLAAWLKREMIREAEERGARRSGRHGKPGLERRRNGKAVSQRRSGQDTPSPNHVLMFQAQDRKARCRSVPMLAAWLKRELAKEARERGCIEGRAEVRGLGCTGAG